MVEVSKVFQEPEFQSLCYDLLFHCRFLFVFWLWYFKRTVILIIYVFICFTAWSINVWLSGRSFQYFGIKQVMWKYTLFLSTLLTRWDNFTFFSAADWISSCYVIWIKDDVIHAIFCGFNDYCSGNCNWEKVIYVRGKRSHLKSKLLINFLKDFL